MNSIARWTLAAIAAPLAGLIALKVSSALEIFVRNVLDKPAVVDDMAVRADAIVSPFLLTGYVILCSIYVLPVSQIVRSLQALISAALVATPPLLLATAFLHQPGLDSFPMTVLALLSVVGFPIFSSALAARLIVGPNNSFKGMPLRGTP